MKRRERATTPSSKRARTAINPRTRDDAFLGIHAASLAELTAVAVATASAAASASASPAPSWSAKFALDPYGTLREKTTRANTRSMVEAAELARSTLLPLVRALTSTPEIRGRCKVRAINPPLWTLGHVAFFYESLLLDVLEAPKENLRAADAEVGQPDGLFNGLPRKSLFDSIRVNRAERVASPLWADPKTSHIFLYAKAVLADVVHYLTASSVALLHPVDSYIAMYAVIHEHWHIEDLLMTLQMMAVAIPEQSPQTLTFPMIVTESSVCATRAPVSSSFASTSSSSSSSSSLRVVAVSPPPPPPITTAVATERLPSWISVPASTYLLGASKTDPFVFGQEKWGHKCEVSAFQIARYPVTNEEFMQFIDDGGYENRLLWSIEGWRWKTENDVASPLYWEKRDSGGQWQVRRFEQWIPVCPGLATHPVAHVSYWEAEAYCEWCGGGARLPTEAEWEVAATWPPVKGHEGQRRYPWGSDFFMGGAAEGGASSLVYRANLGHRVQSTHGTVPVAAFGQKGESALGLSQLVGNVWEWTRTTFYPFPGYQMDFPYRENAAPWFGFSKVAKGGAWSTSEYLAHSKHRNFYDAGGRREVVIGFRVVR
jgi:iron(II)-dependent oxidoreductase